MVSREKKIEVYLVIALLFVMGINTSLSYLLMVTIFIVWLWRGDLKNRIVMIIKDPLAQTFLALFLIHLLGIFWTQSYEEGVKILSKQKTYLIAAIILTFFNKAFAKYAIMAFFTALAFSEITALYLYLTHLGAAENNPSPFMHRMHYSLILAFSFGYLIQAINFKALREKRNLFLLLFAIFTLMILFINTGRIGQLALPVVLFLLAIYKFHFSWFKSLLITLIGATLLFFLAYNLSGNFKERIQHATHEFKDLLGTGQRDSIVCRFEMWHYATQLGKSNPIIGIGTGDSVAEMERLMGKKEFQKLFSDCGLGMKYQFNPHNNFILYFMQFGLLGVIVLLWVLLSQILLALRLNSLPMLLLLSVTVVGMMTTSLISIHIKYMFFYAFMLSMLYLDAQKEKTLS